ncbi:MAG: sensor domain-containing diguanylate cyclase [Chloroflexi bacterium]|nr:sensor domain-containing diguanylate cyclase [Chloroflexota bacterium]
MTQPDLAAAGAVLAPGARALARGADLDATLDAIVGAAATAVGDARVALFVATGAGEALHLAASRNLAAAERAALAAAAGDPGHPVAVAARGARAAAGRGAAAELPLVVAREGIDEILGVLAVDRSGGRPFDDGERAALEVAADLAAVAIDRARLGSLASERSDWIDRVATADPLTGLANRRTLDRVLELEIERARRQKTDVSVAVFDVDDFRAANERGGSAAGDAVLRAVAATLAEQVRLVDTVARIGGDEFAVVAPGSGGVVVADRLLRAIEALGPVDGVAVTVSAGVARFPADGTSADELLGAALGALAGARAAGRGMIAEVRAG